MKTINLWFSLAMEPAGSIKLGLLYTFLSNITTVGLLGGISSYGFSSYYSVQMFYYRQHNCKAFLLYVSSCVS